MHAGVVSFRAQPGKMEEAVRTYRDMVMPTLQEQKGYKGGLLMTDAETSKGYVVGLWETQDDAEAFESSGAYQEQVARFGAVFAEPPVRETYEVSVRV